MAYELHGILTGAEVKQAYDGGFESFLNNVVSPIYWVIFKVLVDFIIYFYICHSVSNFFSKNAGG